MAGKGYGADPTLVSAAFRLGQSYIPKDYSDIFAKQYEGMIAAYKAKYEAIGEGIKAIGETTGEIFKKHADIKGEWAEELDKLDEGLGFDDGLNEAATGYNDAVQEEQKPAYENGDIYPNKAEFDAEKLEFEDLKEQIEKLNKKGVFLGKKGKQKRIDLIREAVKLRETINKSRADSTTYNTATTSLLIDRKLTFKDNPDLQFLLAEKSKKDGDLRDIDVEVFFKDGKKHYKYPVGLAARIYNKIQREKGAEDKVLIGPENQEYLTISEEQLYKGVVYKDNESRNTIRDGHMKEVADAASAINGKNLAVKNYGDIEVLTKQRIKKTLTGSSSYQNLTNEGILIGNTEVNWSEELPAVGFIDEIIVNQEGLGSDILVMADLDGNKIIDDTEWGKLKAEKDKHDQVKTQILDKLLNPQTPQEKEFSINAYSEFISDKARQVFNSTREQMGYVYNEENQTWTMPDTKDPWWKQKGFSNIDQGMASEWYKKNVLNQQESGYIPLGQTKNSTIFKGGGGDYFDEERKNQLDGWGSVIAGKETIEGLTIGDKKVTIGWSDDLGAYVQKFEDKTEGYIYKNNKELLEAIFLQGDEEFAPGYFRSQAYKSIPDWNYVSSEEQKEKENEEFAKYTKSIIANRSEKNVVRAFNTDEKFAGYSFKQNFALLRDNAMFISNGTNKMRINLDGANAWKKIQKFMSENPKQLK